MPWLDEGPVAHFDPGSNDVGLYAALVRPSKDPEVAVLTPLRAPRVGTQLQNGNTKSVILIA